MKFFFPDSLDVVDPSFDFETEKRATFRIRQRDDIYAHELFSDVPFTGILVSKTSVDGEVGERSRYSMGQRHRLLRQGVREFFRLDEVKTRPRIDTIGDCGAFSYAKEKYPPFTVREVADFYRDCGFDFGVSVDHIIFEYEPNLDVPGVIAPAAIVERQQITLQLAEEFLKLHRKEKFGFYPVGVAQGWSPKSYADSVSKLQKMGYDYIGLGGMVPLKTNEILACLREIDSVRSEDTKLHIFGITRVKEVTTFSEYGVHSLDSTSPLRQAWMDNKDNYYTLDRTYTALRVPQIDGNPKLSKQISTGQVNQDDARKLEQESMKVLKAFGNRQARSSEVLQVLRAYDELQGGKDDRTKAYTEILEDRPWERCKCDICKALGIHVVIFRGAERNRRRGFHNLFVFHKRLQREIGRPKVTT